MLMSVTDFMCRNGNRSQRASVQFILGQTHDPRIRIIMISIFSYLYTDIMQIEAIEHVPRQFAAATRISVGRTTVTL